MADLAYECRTLVATRQPGGLTTCMSILCVKLSPERLGQLGARKGNEFLDHRAKIADLGKGHASRYASLVHMGGDVDSWRGFLGALQGESEGE